MGLLDTSDWKAKWIGWDHGSSSSAISKSKWIWYPEGVPTENAPLGTRYFRRVIQLPEDRTLRSGTLTLTADNEFRLFVNGKQCAAGNDWTKPQRVSVAPFLTKGKNAIAIEVKNVGDGPSPAGLIAMLELAFDHSYATGLSTDQDWKSSSTFEQGWTLLNFNDSTWSPAKDLGACGIQPWGAIDQLDRHLSARYLRHEFRVNGSIRRATAYVCGLGFFNLSVNGKPISSDMMDPALSDYKKADYYVAFDVTGHLKEGRNAIGVVLGNGRFFAPRPNAESFGFPKLLLQMDVEYSDGRKQQVLSDTEDWQVTTNGPTRENNEYDGETYDARLEMPGWNQPGFKAKGWTRAEAVSPPGGELRSQVIEPMRVIQTFRPVSISQPKPGIYLVDFGQTFYGSVRIKLHGKRGSQVRLTSAYALKPDGTLKTADNRTALCTDIYTFKGQGAEVWNPSLKGQGFRRVQLEGLRYKPSVNDFEGLDIHTDVEPVGSFQCSNDLINRIHVALNKDAVMFLRSAPLDPDRDERQPWTGDPAKDAESEAYNFNVAAFYAKWMDDMERSERPDGTIPDVSMYWLAGAGVEWPSVFTIIPDWFVDFYGDPRVAESHYEAMKRWVLAMRRYERPDGTLQGTSFGDWCDTSTMGGKVSDNGSTPQELVSSAYQYENYRILQRAAELNGKTEDAKTFSQLAENLRSAFNRVFLNPRTHTYKGETQCGYVLALQFGLVPADQREGVIRNLVEDIMVRHHGHLTVGLIGMQWLMQTLTEIGRPDVAWTIATQTSRPSWGYMLSKGSTTIWERWDYDTRDPGMNSEALLIQAGNLDAWFYQTLAGIRPAAPGFKKILVKPEPVGDLSWVRAHFDSVYGRIESRWRRTGNRFHLDVNIPANTTATISIPAKSVSSVRENGNLLDRNEKLRLKLRAGRTSIEVGSGKYSFDSVYEPRK